jgi:hypothetical protein
VRTAAAIAALLLATPAFAEPVLTRAPELLIPAETVAPEALRHLEGDVVLQLIVGVDGAVSEVTVLSGIDPELDAWTVEQALLLRFSPAEVDGEPSAIAIEFSVHYEPPPVVSSLVGRLFDRRSARPLKGATVSISQLDVEVQTGRDGRFELLDLPPGEHTVVLFHPDFEREARPLLFEASESVTVEAYLAPTSVVGETIVTSRAPWRVVERAPLVRDETPTTGRWTLTRRDIELAPGAMGDVAKVVGTLPGVAADTDMFATLHVRGGAQHETGFFLDGVPLLNPNHLGGIFTLFNPKLIDTVTLDTASIAPAFADSLSGALSVKTIDGDSRDWDMMVDANMAMASAVISGPIGKRGSPVTFLLSARRSYFEAYLALMKAVGVLGDEWLGISFGEYTGRVTIGKEGAPHRLRFTLMHSHDGMEIRSGDPDSSDALVTIEQGIATSNSLTLLSGDWRWRIAEPVRLTTLVYFTHDDASSLQDADFTVSRRVQTWRPGGRLTLAADLFEGNTLSAGIDAQWFSLGGDGVIKDPRLAPAWAALPWAGLVERELTFDATQSWNEVAVFVHDEWERVGGIPLNLEFGLRANLAGPTGEVLFSPRGGLSVPLPSYTTLKVSAGLYHQTPRDPAVLEHATDLKSERAFAINGGVEQFLPFGAIVRVEGYHKILDRLLVHPDTLEALERGESWQSVGTGTASGVDVSFAARGAWWNALATYSFSHTERTNPLNTAGPKTYQPGWAQQHGLRLMGQVRFGKNQRWSIAANWELRSGRRRTPVARRRAENGTWFVAPYAYNSLDYGAWTELSLRAEYGGPILKGKAKLSVYIDVLNATHAQGEFIWMYGEGEPQEDGTLSAPTPSVFPQLPIRPWLGMRLEF